MRAATNTIFLAVLLLVSGPLVPLRASRADAPPASRKTRLYIGTLTTDDKKGIYQAEFDDETGSLRLHGLAAVARNASFLAFGPDNEHLYATCEVDEFADSQAGALAAFKVDASTGNLTLLNCQSSRGGVPCHVAIDRQGKFALVANYVGGNVAVLPIRDDGRLAPAVTVIHHYGSSVHKVRQQGPHPHSVTLDAANRFAFVADAGLDQIAVYRFDGVSGGLAANTTGNFKMARGAAPRHMAFHPAGNLAFVINELDSTVTALRYDSEHGRFDELQTLSTLPSNFSGDNLTAEILVHPSGRFVYGSNRGHDSLAMFALNQDQVRLTSLGQHPAGGRTPRSFCIDPTGKFLLSAQQDSNNVVVHKIDPTSGMLARTKHEINVQQPLCLRFVPSTTGITEN